MNLPLIGLAALILMSVILVYFSKSNNSIQPKEDPLGAANVPPIENAEGLQEKLVNGKVKEKLAAIDGLMEVSPPGLGQMMVNAMADKNEEVKMAAAAALVQLKDAVTVPLLVEALRDTGRWLPARIAEVLVAIGEPAVPSLVAAANDESEQVRAYAVQILGMMNIAETLSILVQGLRDNSVEVRRAAAAVLAEQASKEVVPQLIEALGDSDSRVRIQVIRALGIVGSDTAVDALDKAARDEDWNVSASAVGALGKLGAAGEERLLNIARNAGHPAQKQALALVETIGVKSKTVVNINYGHTQE